MTSTVDINTLLKKRLTWVSTLQYVLVTARAPVPAADRLERGENTALVEIIKFFLLSFSPALSFLVSHLTPSLTVPLYSTEDVIDAMYRVSTEVFDHVPVLDKASFLLPSEIALSNSEYSSTPLQILVDLAAISGTEQENELRVRLERGNKRLRIVTGFATRCVNLHRAWIARSLERLNGKTGDDLSDVYIRSWQLDEELNSKKETRQWTITQALLSHTFDSREVLQNKTPSSPIFPDLAVPPYVLKMNGNMIHDAFTRPSFTKPLSNSTETTSQSTLTPVHVTLLCSRTVSTDSSPDDPQTRTPAPPIPIVTGDTESIREEEKE